MIKRSEQEYRKVVKKSCQECKDGRVTRARDRKMTLDRCIESVCIKGAS